MIKTIIGIILLLLPFILLYRLKDKKLGFAYILSFILAFQLVVAVLTQTFGIFRYWVIVGINLITVMIMFKFVDYKKLINSLKKIKIDWILIFVVIILFIQLFSIHYNYTGTITKVSESFLEVQNMKYPYPYFSDEWSAISLIQYSIESGKLPLVNPLWHNIPFPNLELPFHSFVSEIMLLLNLNPLTQYTLITIWTGILICLLVYLFLRFNGIGKLVSGATALSISFIINGANLPGIWYLMPLTLGLISLLLSLFFFLSGDKKMILFLGALTLIFYPPLFIFYTISLISYFIVKKDKENWKMFGLFLIIGFVVSLILSVFAYFAFEGVSNFVYYIFEKLFYETFTPFAIPDFSIWKIVPIVSLVLAVFGAYNLIRKKQRIWLVVPVIIGLIYWWIYSFILWRFIIEYERVVVTTSMLLVILSGFGLFYLIRYLNNYNFIRKYKIPEVLMILFLILAFAGSFSYTENNNWQNLKLHSVVDEEIIFSPAAPANNYLTEEDLQLFSGITGKNFLSVPWKGLVIGTATKNYPLHSKPSTLTNEIVFFDDFKNADCQKKKEISLDFGIDYVYSPEFICEGFNETGKNEQEELVLYEVLD